MAGAGGAAVAGAGSAAQEVGVDELARVSEARVLQKLKPDPDFLLATYSDRSFDPCPS